ncbi:hypothetical protein GRI75_03590 [Altererythrobacter soli]|uniref:Peptidase S9 prolyl oligopeptidase catalytic domain-containing protein n=1 Tax=Croceibacterium soli TaxID=1739690 RepID=A0A6I4UP74_9SPHN|nr:hypothetical protein [Croceibacterium soli]MXP40731.1 hypothetical protein [Croceibacterium soli]
MTGKAKCTAWCRTGAGLLLAWHCAAAAGAVQASPATSVARWTVEDSIALQSIVTDWAEPSVRGRDGPAQFSPDGSRYFVVTYSGELASDRSVYRLSVYSRAQTADWLRGRLDNVQPTHVFERGSRLRSTVGSAAIYVPRWLDDSTISFIGVDEVGIRRVCRYDLRTGRAPECISGSASVAEIGGQDYVARGSTTLFFTVELHRSKPRDYPFQLLDAETLYDLAGRDGISVLSANSWTMHASYKGAAPRPIVSASIDSERGGARSGPWISPDERWAVMAFQPDGLTKPADWNAYPFATSALRYILFDLATGERRTLTDLPLAAARIRANPSPFTTKFYTRASSFWSHDSSHLLLFNIAGSSESRPDKTSQIVDYNVATGKSRVVETLADGSGLRADPEWIDEGKRLKVRFEAKGGKSWVRHYNFTSAGWLVGDTNQRKGGPPVDELTFTVRGGLGEPPRLLVEGYGKERVLFSAGPASSLAKIRPFERIDWTDEAGNPAYGYLVRGRPTPGQSPRLIVQFLGSTKDDFAPDGISGTADAAQLLAANGFTVFLMQAAGGYGSGRETQSEIILTPSEFPAQVLRLDSAVDELKRRGLAADLPSGLIGFSRTGTYTYYVATHPGRTPVGAAIVFDSITNGYSQYVSMAATATEDVQSTSHYAWQFGNRKAFWWNKVAWLDAPEFNLDRLKSPILFHVTGNPILWDAHSTIGAFKLARRPIEYHYHPGAAHVLQAPAERAAAMRSTLDWMRFWLRGEEIETREEDRARKERWESLKTDWTKVQREEAATASFDGEQAG